MCVCVIGVSCQRDRIVILIRMRLSGFSHAKVSIQRKQGERKVSQGGIEDVRVRERMRRKGDEGTSCWESAPESH